MSKFNKSILNNKHFTSFLFFLTFLIIFLMCCYVCLVPQSKGIFENWPKPISYPINIEPKKMSIAEKFECISTIYNYLPGTWRAGAHDALSSPFVELKKDHTFVHSYEPGNHVTSLGTWEYLPSNGTIKFNFIEYDHDWIKILSTNIERYYGIESYSFEEKYLEVGLDNLPNLEIDNLTECKERYIAIKFFGWNLHKKGSKSFF